jgi:HAD hydrolase, family IA, variant 3
VSVDDVQHAKPAPDMVLKTLDFLHVLPKETLVVGDTPFDIRMGKAANVQTVGVTYGNGTRTELKESGADYIIDCFEQLLPIVSRGEEMAI